MMRVRGKGNGRGRTAGTGPGGMGGRWGRECYGGRIWLLEGKMERGWGLWGQVRCWEGGGSGMGPGGAGRMLGGGRGKLVAGGEGELG